MSNQNFREIKGCLYRVNTKYSGFLVECANDSYEGLMRFCAKISVKGYMITSVTRIFEDSKDTPRVSVMSQPEYKEIFMEELRRSKYGPYEAGDTVYTNRFCNVTLKEVFDSESEMMAAGYTEPTYNQNEKYIVRGKSTGMNHMVFAAAPKA